VGGDSLSLLGRARRPAPRARLGGARGAVRLSPRLSDPGAGSRAHETTEALLDWVQGQHNLPQLLTTYAFCGELALLRGEVESAQQWLELAGEQEVLGSMDLLEDPPITHARLLLT